MMYPEEIQRATKQNLKQKHTKMKGNQPSLGFIWLNLGLIALVLALFSHIHYTPIVTIESFKPNAPYPMPANPFSDKEKEIEIEIEKEIVPKTSEEEKVVEFYEECTEDMEETNYVALLVATPTYSIDPILLFSIIKDTWGDEAKIRIIRGCTPFDEEFLGKLS